MRDELKVNDMIIAIDDLDVQHMSHVEVGKLLCKSKLNTKRKISIIREPGMLAKQSAISSSPRRSINSNRTSYSSAELFVSRYAKETHAQSSFTHPKVEAGDLNIHLRGPLISDIEENPQSIEEELTKLFARKRNTEHDQSLELQGFQLEGDPLKVHEDRFNAMVAEAEPRRVRVAPPADNSCGNGDPLAAHVDRFFDMVAKPGDPLEVHEDRFNAMLAEAEPRSSKGRDRQAADRVNAHGTGVTEKDTNAELPEQSVWRNFSVPAMGPDSVERAKAYDKHVHRQRKGSSKTNADKCSQSTEIGPEVIQVITEYGLGPWTEYEAENDHCHTTAELDLAPKAQGKGSLTKRIEVASLPFTEELTKRCNDQDS